MICKQSEYKEKTRHQNRNAAEQMELCFSLKCISRPRLTETAMNASVFGGRCLSIAELRQHEA